jgi:CRP-like cAMP-binding protein
MINEDLLLTLGATYRKIKRGDFIFHEGAKCNYYFQLIDGKISWLNYDEEGKIFIQSIVEKGECFGELPLFDGEPYAASAMAETDVIIIQLPKSSFLQFIKDNPDISLSFCKLFAQRMRYKFFILKEIACHTPEKKVITLLNYVKEKKNISLNEPYKVTLTRQEIAGMTGLRVETVIRAIRHLNEQGKLSINKGKVYLPKVTTIIK